jgi:hypothetical protein
MTFPTEKPSDSNPAPKPQQQTETFNPEVLVLARQKVLLAKTIWWLLVNHNANNGNSARIDENNIPDLWNLTFPQDDKFLHVKADLLPEITEKQITQVVKLLIGTTKRILEAIDKFKLPQPPQYIEAMIRDHIVLVKGTWVATRLAEAQEHSPSQ